MIDWTREQKREAARLLNELGWDVETFGAWHPKRQASEIDNVISGSGVLIPAHRLIPYICELNYLRSTPKSVQGGDSLDNQVRLTEAAQLMLDTYAKLSNQETELVRWFGDAPFKLRDAIAALRDCPPDAPEDTNENQANVRMVRPVDRGVLGSEETNLVSLPITDDRDCDYVDPRLKNEADLVIEPKCTDAPLKVRELPALEDECSDSDVMLRASRWTGRCCAIIDDEDGHLIADGDAANHAGIEAEWELIQRERQLAAVIEEAEMQKRLVAEKSVIIGHLQRELEKQDRQMSDGVQEKGV